MSALARVEVPAALWRKHRSSEVSIEDLTALIDEFEWDYYERFSRVAVEAAVLADAARAVGRHSLRAYDAVQLACAMAGRNAAAELSTFATFDQGLERAAAGEGFALLG